MEETPENDPRLERFITLMVSPEHIKDNQKFKLHPKTKPEDFVLAFRARILIDPNEVDELPRIGKRYAHSIHKLIHASGLYILNRFDRRIRELPETWIEWAIYEKQTDESPLSKSKLFPE